MALHAVVVTESGHWMAALCCTSCQDNDTKPLLHHGRGLLASDGACLGTNVCADVLKHARCTFAGAACETWELGACRPSADSPVVFIAVNGPPRNCACFRQIRRWAGWERGVFPDAWGRTGLHKQIDLWGGWNLRSIHRECQHPSPCRSLDVMQDVEVSFLMHVLRVCYHLRDTSEDQQFSDPPADMRNSRYEWMKAGNVWSNDEHGWFAPFGQVPPTHLPLSDSNSAHDTNGPQGRPLDECPGRSVRVRECAIFGLQLGSSILVNTRLYAYVVQRPRGLAHHTAAPVTAF
eukprot:365378-Chlamydomonas_euryale.AAC.9